MSPIKYFPFLLALCLQIAMPSFAEEAKPLANDPALEARVMAVAAELRCLVCQNESIAGSHADLAVDLRNQIRDQLQQGKSQAQIIQYMVDRYGDFVLYRPPVKPYTWLLWFGPFVLVILGLWGIRRYQQDQAKGHGFSASDLEQARALLDGNVTNANLPSKDQ